MTDTPNSILDILQNFEQQVVTGHGGATLKHHAEAEQAINAYILGEVMGLLNGDEKVEMGQIESIGYEAGTWDNHTRNQLRQELRNKANKKFGGK